MDKAGAEGANLEAKIFLHWVRDLLWKQLTKKIQLLLRSLDVRSSNRRLTRLTHFIWVRTTLRHTTARKRTVRRTMDKQVSQKEAIRVVQKQLNW